MPIQLIGLKRLGDDEISVIDRISSREIKKIERDLKNSKVTLRITKQDKEGRRARYAIEAKINAPSAKLVAQAEEWDIAKAMHKIFNKLQQEIQHNFPD